MTICSTGTDWRAGLPTFATAELLECAGQAKGGRTDFRRVRANVATVAATYLAAASKRKCAFWPFAVRIRRFSPGQSARQSCPARACETEGDRQSGAWSLAGKSSILNHRNIEHRCDFPGRLDRTGRTAWCPRRVVSLPNVDRSFRVLYMSDLHFREQTTEHLCDQLHASSQPRTPSCSCSAAILVKTKRTAAVDRVGFLRLPKVPRRGNRRQSRSARRPRHGRARRGAGRRRLARSPTACVRCRRDAGGCHGAIAERCPGLTFPFDVCMIQTHLCRTASANTTSSLPAIFTAAR